MCIAFSGIFYLWADVSPSTGTVYRALFGLPLLALVALAERRRYGPLPRRALRFAAIAGVLFAGDLLTWHHAIEYVGAGLATVLGNLQVLIVGAVAWLLFGERPSRNTLLAVPVVLVGVVYALACVDWPSDVQAALAASSRPAKYVWLHGTCTPSVPRLTVIA